MDIQIRPVHPTDAAAIYRIHLQPSVMPFITAMPSSRLEEYEHRFSHMTPTQHEFVAEVSGQVVGSGGLHQKGGRRAHTGILFLAVDEACHGQGVGSALIRKLLEVADNWLLLEKVELGVLTTNPRAQALYERVGFFVEGCRKAALISNGRYGDEVMMGRFRPGGILDGASAE